MGRAARDLISKEATMFDSRSIPSKLALIALTFAVLSANAQPRLLAAAWHDEQLLEIDPATGVSSVIGPFSHRFVGKPAWDSTSGVLYAVSGDSTFHNLVTINPQTGATTIVGPLGVYFMQGLAYDPNSDTLYGVASGSVSRGLYRVDRQTGAATRLVSITGFNGAVNIAFDPVSNTMYLAEISGQNLRTLNVVTGATTVIGPFEAPAMPFAQVGAGLAFDPAFGLLATDNTGIPGNDNPLYSIDTATGRATLVGYTGSGGIAGLAFIPSCPADLDNDGAIGLQDLATLLAHFGQTGDVSPEDGDLDGDGDVDLQDLAGLLAQFGSDC
jgi:DNA-binding beta-propeller fold protein YncE